MKSYTFASCPSETSKHACRSFAADRVTRAFLRSRSMDTHCARDRKTDFPHRDEWPIRLPSRRVADAQRRAAPRLGLCRLSAVDAVPWACRVGIVRELARRLPLLLGARAKRGRRVGRSDGAADGRAAWSHVPRCSGGRVDTDFAVLEWHPAIQRIRLARGR